MTKVNLLLLAALLGSSLVLVKTSYESRQVFAALDKARGEQRQLDAEFKRLDSERQAQATHGRVDRVARDKLGMRTATPGITQTVFDMPAAATASATGAPR
jgi:cell division protein FtsL